MESVHQNLVESVIELEMASKTLFTGGHKKEAKDLAIVAKNLKSKRDKLQKQLQNQNE